MEGGGLVWWTMSWCGWPGCVHWLPGENLAPWCTIGRRQAAWGSALSNVLLGNTGSCQPRGCYFDTCHLPELQTMYILNEFTHQRDVLDKQVQSTEALLLTSWCQMPQHMFGSSASSAAFAHLHSLHFATVHIRTWWKNTCVRDINDRSCVQ